MEDEGLVLRVGSQAVRWVLMDHAEPWLLTVSSKLGVQPEASTAAEPLLAASSRSKRCRRPTARQSGEPPTKRAHRDDVEGEAQEEPSRGEEQRICRVTEEEKVCSTLEEGRELPPPQAEGETEEQQPPAEEVPESSSGPTQAADTKGE